jgi:hypothetical protein
MRLPSRATQIATQLGYGWVDDAHLLIAIARTRHSRAGAALRSCGLTFRVLIDRYREAAGAASKRDPDVTPVPTPRLRSILAAARRAAHDRGEPEPMPDDYFRAVIANPGGHARMVLELDLPEGADCAAKLIAVAGVTPPDVFRGTWSAPLEMSRDALPRVVRRLRSFLPLGEPVAVNTDQGRGFAWVRWPEGALTAHQKAELIRLVEGS